MFCRLGLWYNRRVNLDVIVDRGLAFYDWVQKICRWTTPRPGFDIYDFYIEDVEFSDEHLAIIDEIKGILQNDKRPYQIISDLYENKYQSKKSKRVTELAKPLRKSFDDNIWRISKPHLELVAKTLETFDFGKFDKHIKSIAKFLDSDINLNDKLQVYLLPNRPDADTTTGNVIIDSKQIRLRPSKVSDDSQVRGMISVLVHEYIHTIENQSRVTQSLMKKSYEKYIEKNNLKRPLEYSWRLVFMESLVYCFANSTTGGYLRPETYDKPRPTVEEMQKGFYKIVDEQRYDTRHILSWVGLNIQPDVEEYIKDGRVIDQHITDRIGRILRDFYLTHGNR